MLLGDWFQLLHNFASFAMQDYLSDIRTSLIAMLKHLLPWSLISMLIRLALKTNSSLKQNSAAVAET